MAKRRGGRFKKMMGLGFISFDKAFSSLLRLRLRLWPVVCCSASNCYRKLGRATMQYIFSSRP
jgi:hypothetical protein